MPHDIDKRTLMLLVGLLLGASATAQTLIYGPTARADFDFNVATYHDRRIDFNSLSAGPLTTQLQPAYGVTFASTIQVDGTPIVPTHEVYVTGTSVFGNATMKIVGTPYPGGVDDGQVGYQITFSTPQARAGLDRLWQSGAALTRFFNSTGTLLATHVNTTGLEFVAYVANYNDPATWVSRIEIDGLVYGGYRQVGYSDNLIYGFAPIPEPSATILLAMGLGGMWFARAVLSTHRRRRSS